MACQLSPHTKGREREEEEGSRKEGSKEREIGSKE